jgi:hypothetical protein
MPQLQHSPTAASYLGLAIKPIKQMLWWSTQQQQASKYSASTTDPARGKSVKATDQLLC